MQVLFDFASDLNVAVEYASLKRRDGEYRHDLKLIRLRDNMSTRLARFTLAHEIAHAIAGDIPSPLRLVNERQERLADEWAAATLINREDYIEVEQLRDGHIPSMAHDLGVVTRAVTAYQRILQRELAKETP